MGHKIVCFSCRKSFSEKPNELHIPEKCPQCGGDIIHYTHRFRSPKKADINAWKVVTFLYEHGFTYQHIYIDPTIYRRDAPSNYASYPNNLIDAREFVTKYKHQAIKLKSVNG